MIQVCLLVSDDPDDQLAFSEAVAEIDELAIVLIVLDSHKGLQFLQSHKLQPDYLFLDISMHGLRINTFLKGIRKEKTLSQMPILVYGEERDFKKIEDPSGLEYFRKDFDYTDLRRMLKDYFSRKGRNP